jgi:hypothetical protein
MLIIIKSINDCLHIKQQHSLPLKISLKFKYNVNRFMKIGVLILALVVLLAAQG